MSVPHGYLHELGLSLYNTVDACALIVGIVVDNSLLHQADE